MDTTRSYSGPPLTARKIVVLLVDDQAIVEQMVRRMLSEEKDIELHYCSDPTKAIKTALEINPTIILQDLVMPEVDGLTLVRFFRVNEKTRDVPLIVLSSKEEPTIKAKAFSLGASDYLVKLPDKIELIARIRHHSKGYINLLQRNEVMRQLAAELAEAAEYVRGLLPPPLTEGPLRTDWRLIPSTSLGGDSFGYYWLDDRHFAAYLLDVCGHGVGAALLSVSVLNVLRTQTLPNTDFRDPGQVLAALNDAFQMEKHGDKFFTIWYGVYDATTHKLVYASGGHPPAILVQRTADGHVTNTTLSTSNPIIGAMPGLPYACGSVEITGPVKLYLYSDGVYEITAPDGTLWTLEGLVNFIAEPPAEDHSRLDELWQFVRKLGGSDNLEDDFSILEIFFE